MKIGLQTFGSDGDVRPFIALAGGLSERGHQVTLVITSKLQKNYAKYGDALNFKIIHAQETYKVWESNYVSEKMEDIIKDGNPLTVAKNMAKAFFEPAVDEMYEASKRLCAENDMVIGHYLLYPLQIAAEKQSLPYGSVHFFPGMIPSQNTLPPATFSLGKWSNVWWWKFAKYLMNSVSLDDTNTLRQREGLHEVVSTIQDVWLSKNLTLIPSSSTLYPRPVDWDEHIHLSGFWGVQENAEAWIMPDTLKNFFAAGEPPVYITFGVVSPMAAQDTINILIQAVQLAGCRAIIQAPWKTLADVEDNSNIYRVDAGQVPHNKIFPACSLVVHHGGAGTTHSASLAGCPSVVVEHFGDQYFWGTMLKKAGIAHAPLRRRALTAKSLAKEINRVLSSSKMKETAIKISELMQKEENGISYAVRTIENYFYRT